MCLYPLRDFLSTIRFLGEQLHCSEKVGPPLCRLACPQPRTEGPHVVLVPEPIRHPRGLNLIYRKCDCVNVWTDANGHLRTEGQPRVMESILENTGPRGWRVQGIIRRSGEVVMVTTEHKAGAGGWLSDLEPWLLLQGAQVHSQHLRGSSQLLTPAPGDLVPSSGL